MALRCEGDVLIVGEADRLPKVCLKCGARKEIGRHPQQFALGKMGQVTGAGGGVLGAVVAAGVRNTFRDDGVAQAMVLGGIIAAVAGIAWVMHAQTPKATLELPLCAACASAADEARRAQRTAIVGGVGFLVCVLAGIALDAMALVALGLGIFVLLLFFARAAQIPQRLVVAAWVKNREIGLRLTPEIAGAIVERAERRARKRDEARDAASEPDDEA